jgi:dCTP deaminase
MILTGKQIKKELEKGTIRISNFKESSIQPNSYDFHLGSELILYSEGVLNEDDKTIQGKRIHLTEEGYILMPHEFYLGITVEATASDRYTQLLFGDSSLSSLGIWVQISAPMAHVGSKIRWTLEIRCLRKVKIYPGMKFGKICFLANYGIIKNYGHHSFADSGRYLENKISHSLINSPIKRENTNRN